MSFGRTKLLLSFAFVGFVVGSIGYAFINWLIINIGLGILYLPIPIFAPWFLSGIAGSFLTILVVSIAAHYSQK